MMHSNVSRASFIAAAAAAAAAPGLPASAQGMTKVTIGGTGSDDVTAIVYGQNSGLFAKYGLDVQIVKMANGSAGVAGLLSGTFTFAKAAITSILSAHEKHLPFALVAETAINEPGQLYGGFLVNKSSPIETAKDLNGALVAVAALDDIGSLALRQLSDQTGGDPKSIRFVEVPFGAGAAAVESGRVAAAENSNPTMARAMATGKFRVLHVFDSIAPRYLQAGLIVNREFSNKNPELVKTFSRAYAESVRYTAAHHAETVQMMSAFSGIPIEVYRSMVRATSWPTVVASQVQPVIDAAAKFGLIQKTFPASEIIDANIAT